MDLERHDQDDEVIRLLGKLNEAAPEYPANLQAERRAAVMAGFAALNLGASAAGIGLVAHLVKIVKAMGVVEKIILAAEVTAVTGLTAYGAATAYVYRDEIRQMLFPGSISSNTPFPTLFVSSPLPATEVAIGTGTPTPTPTGTLTITVPPYATSGGGSAEGTPEPPTEPPVANSTNAGHHYGQTGTPAPKQTKNP